MWFLVCLLAMVSLSHAQAQEQEQEQDAIETGRALLGGPEHEKGVRLIREGIAKLEKQQPATAQSLHRIGLGYFYLQDDAKAEASFAKAAELEPKEPEHVFMRGVVQMYGDPEAAVATLRKAMELGPKNVQYRLALVRVLRRLKRDEEALVLCLQACRVDPKSAEAHHEAAKLLLGAGRDEEALDHLRLAVECDPKLVDAWYNLGQVAYNRRRFEDAFAAWSKAAALQPDDFQTRTKLVQALFALGRYADAEPHRKRVFALRPKGRKEFCFDQFDVGKSRVFAYETFEKSGDLYYHFTFKVVTPAGKIEKTVNLESSAVIRELGFPYILGANLPGGVHRNYGIQWKALPPYAQLKALVVKAAKGELD